MRLLLNHLLYYSFSKTSPIEKFVKEQLQPVKVAKGLVEKTQVQVKETESNTKDLVEQKEAEVKGLINSQEQLVSQLGEFTMSTTVKPVVPP